MNQVARIFHVKMALGQRFGILAAASLELDVESEQSLQCVVAGTAAVDVE